MSAQATTTPSVKPLSTGFNTAFIVAWFFCLLFYFMEYAVRSAPSVMLPEIAAAFGLTTTQLSSLIAYVAAILLSAILTLFLRETGSTTRTAH